MSKGPFRRRFLLLGAIAAVALVALTAVPGFAAKPPAAKIYNLAVTPHSAGAGISTNFDVTMTNVSPGNSNVNSFSITAPEGFTVSAASITAASNPNLLATVGLVAPRTVQVQNLDPVKPSPNQFVTVRITATTPSVTCPSQVFTWVASVSTGNNLTGDSFALNNPGDDQKTTLSCIVLRFVSGRTPQDAIQGETITNTDLDPDGSSVQVELVAGDTPVDVTTSNGAVTLSLASSPTPPGALDGNTADLVHGVAEFPDLMLSNILGPPLIQAGGDYRLKATYATHTSTDSPTFTIFDARLCPPSQGDPSYQEESETTTEGHFEIVSQTAECFGIIVNNFAGGGPGQGNFEDWSAIKSATSSSKIQGTMTIGWDLGDGTDPVPWTQVTWEGLNGVYHDVQLCIPGVPFDSQFPPSTIGSGTEQICLISSELVQVGTHWEQLEQFAFDTDMGARK